ncbi:Conserved hypothetical protein [Candidatus Protochlamydia naegleriophila]|uniref:Uncharacterized protein n=1 Tax=Candidatus Protochlamydia naegleriophila TaxID=389348 RepID=A0A0U5JFB7_9BACT|nr:hypothetical protein [Candidatus Protochlamydia naegleriophila]CUI17298.1 Conserved hypothetical protein [Candidatus Protochlamydia naegleriophila]
MHVNDKHIPTSSYDLKPLQQGAKQNEQGTIQGRTAFVIDVATHNTDLAKSANSTNNQVVKIPSKNQSSIEAESLKATSLKTNPAIASVKTQTILSNPHMNEQFERMRQFGISKERTGVMYIDKLVPANSPELINADPSEIGPVYAIFEQEDGRLALAVEADQAEHVRNQAHTYTDANGQIQQYGIVIIDPEISDQLKNILDDFVATHITPNLAPREKEKEHEKKEVDEKPTSHTPPQPTRYEYNPKIVENKNKDEQSNDTSKLLSENPKVILKNVLEAESLLEAKKMNQERAQEAKKKLIDEQEERREIRHEGYKHDEIKQGKRQHDILNETIHHQETERPASVSTTQQSKQDGK